MELFNGELINPHEQKVATVNRSDEEINEKYRSGDIRIVTEQARYPLNTISSMVHSRNYKMNPEYQRRHRWNNARRSSLIESLIMNVPIPPVFLYEYEYSSYEVMDGLQRLTAIASFYDNEFALEDLKKWPELNGRRYSQLPQLVQQGIDRRYISSIILLHETAKTKIEAEKLKQMVFDRINSGGELLTPQEKRNANFDGPLNRLCIKLSTSPKLCAAWGIPVGDEGDTSIHSERAENKFFKTMADVELVLRFFAYRQRKDLQKGSLESYLDFYLLHGNKFHEDVLCSLGNLFANTVSLAVDLFDEKAFYIYRNRKTGWGWYERPTTVVYDPMMYVLSKNIDKRDLLLSKKEEINDALVEFYKINYDVFEGRNTNPTALDERDSKFGEFIGSFLS